MHRATVFALILSSCGGSQATQEASAPKAENRIAMSQSPKSAQTELYPQLRDFVESKVLPAMESVPAERRETLREVAAFMRVRMAEGKPALLTFICTHNSRRSHMSQLWAQTAGAYYGVREVRTFSGGTEATAFNPRAVSALERAGFSIENPGGDNPHYEVRFGPDGPKMEAFSKIYSEAPNPADGFVALMNCSEADAACPFVKGADLRVSLAYVDPKEADNTEIEAQRYDERSLQIASEMFLPMQLFSEEL